MFKIKKIVWLGVVLLLIPAHVFAYQIEVVNMSKYELRNYPVRVSLSKLPFELQTFKLIVENTQGEKIPSQVDDLDGDGKPDELCFLVSLSPRSKKVLSIKKVEQIPCYSTDLGVLLNTGEEIHFGNRFLKVEIKNKPQGVSFYWAENGERILAGIGINKSQRGKGISLISYGPVRIIVDKNSFSWNRAISYRERYVLYAKNPYIIQYLQGTNLTDEPHPFMANVGGKKWSPGLFWSFLIGRFAEGMGEKEDLQVFGLRRRKVINLKDIKRIRWGKGWGNSPPTDNRLCCMVIGPKKPFSVGLICHSSNYGRITTQSEGSFAVGCVIGEYSCQKPEERRRYSPVGAGLGLRPKESREFGFSFHFYPEGVDKAGERLEEDYETVVGVVTVISEEGEVLTYPEGPNYFTEDFATVDRWLTTEGAMIEKINEGAKITFTKKEAKVYVPLVRDFEFPTELRGEILTLTPPGKHISLSVRERDTQERLSLITLNQKGKFSLSVNKKTGWKGRKSFYLEIAPVGITPSEKIVIHLKDICLSWPLPEIFLPDQDPSLGYKYFPHQDAELSDVGVSLIIGPIPQIRKYEFQISKNRDFSSPEIYCVYHGTYADRPVPVEYVPEKLLEKGTYFWRVRGISPDGIPGRWSEIRSFKVTRKSKEISSINPERKISPEKPLFLFNIRAHRPHYILDFWESLPPELKPYSGVWSGSLYLAGSGQPGRVLSQLKKQEIPLFFQGGLWLSFREWSYQKFPSIEGPLYSEGTLGLYSEAGRRNMVRQLELARQYGKRLVYLSRAVDASAFLQIGAHERIVNLLKKNPDLFVPVLKSNNHNMPLQSHSLLSGLWFADIVKNIGLHTEWYFANNLRGYRWNKKVKEAPVEWMMPLILGLASGATVFSVENIEPCCWDPKSKKFTEVWNKALYPFFKDVIEHQLIPNKEEVIKNVKVAIKAKKEDLVGGEGSLNLWDILNIAYKFRHENEWIPNTSQYYFIPILPILSEEKVSGKFKKVVSIGEFRQNGREYLNKFYPPTENEAFAVTVGKTSIVINTHELPRKGKKAPEEHFSLKFSSSPVDKITGKVGFSQYLIIKEEGEQLFIHANNFTGRNTEFYLYAEEEPQIIVKPKDALKEVKWEESEKRIKVKVSHKGGGVRIFVK